MMRFPCARASRGRSLHHCAAAGLAALAALLPVAANADRADTLLDAGRLVQARAAFMQILSSRPNDVPALVGLARTEYALGHERAADELLVHAHALAPGDQDVERLREERDRYADAIVAYQFGWGNGQTWHLAGLYPSWHANGTSQYGVIGERYVLADPSGVVGDDRVGVSAAFGDVDAFQVRIRALSSQYAGYPAQFNGALDVLGSVRHFRYAAGVSRTGIESAPSAQVDLITTAGAGEVLSNLTGQLGWASKSTSAYVRGRTTDFSDGNRYSLVGFGAMQNVGITAFDAEVGGFINESGYAFVYPLALAGYYSYPHESEAVLQASVRFALGRHFQASATGNAGTAQTAYGAGYQSQNRQQFLPALAYTNHNLTVTASGSFAQYLGATFIPDFEGNRVELSLTTRL